MMVSLVLFPAAAGPCAIDQVWATEAPHFLPAAAEGQAAQPTWVDDLGRQLATHFKAKYPAYDFAPYAQELDRVRSAVNRGDHRGVKLEMGVFLRMLADRAYGLGDDAADELILFAQRVMPAEEFGIIFPRSLSDIDRSTAPNDLRPSASFTARKTPQCISVNTPSVFQGRGLASGHTSFASSRTAMSDRLLGQGLSSSGIGCTQDRVLGVRM
jgi:hypothetical protein